MTSGLKFFIVEDDPDMANIMVAFLESAGHTASYDLESTDVIQKIEAAKPDCVLMGIMMPGMDGLELCKRLRDHPGMTGLRIIVVSSKSYEFDRKRSFELGADGFITKSLEKDSFLEYLDYVLNDDVEVSFWGVHGTLPVPGPRTARYGGNTSCVSMEFVKDLFFIFDAGSGIKELSNHLLENNRNRLEAKIFISHPHWDHINALPFFVPLYMQGNEFEILGAANADLSMREMISAQMEGVYFPITLKEFASRVYFRDLREEVIEYGDVKIRTMLLSHPGYCLGYRVEYHGKVICYVTDNELFLANDPSHNPGYVEKLQDFVRGADMLITDTTYTDEEYVSKVGWGHSCISEVVDLAHNADVKNLYLFHHDPDQDDDAIDAKLDIAQGMLKDKGSSTICHAPAELDVVRV